MKVIAILNVDEEKLKETGHSFEEEMGWVKQSGVTVEKHWDVSNSGDYEYAAFCWNTREQRYDQMQRPVMTEALSRARYEEYVKKGWFNECYDTSKVIFKKRLVHELSADWETVDERRN